MEKINLRKVEEIVRFNPDVEIDMREMFIKSIQKRLSDELGVFIRDENIKPIEEDKPIEEEYAKVKNKLLGKYGSVDNIRIKKEVENMNSFIYLREVKGNVIKAVSYSYSETLGFEYFWGFYEFIVKGNYERDFKNVHSFLESNDRLNEKKLRNFEEVDTGEFKFKKFKNKNINIVCKSEEIANKVLKSFQIGENLRRLI